MRQSTSSVKLECSEYGTAKHKYMFEKHGYERSKNDHKFLHGWEKFNNQ